MHQKIEQMISLLEVFKYSKVQYYSLLKDFLPNGEWCSATYETLIVDYPELIMHEDITKVDSEYKMYKSCMQLCDTHGIFLRQYLTNDSFQRIGKVLEIKSPDRLGINNEIQAELFLQNANNMSDYSFYDFYVERGQTISDPVPTGEYKSITLTRPVWLKLEDELIRHSKISGRTQTVNRYLEYLSNQQSTFDESELKAIYDEELNG